MHASVTIGRMRRYGWVLVAVLLTAVAGCALDDPVPPPPQEATAVCVDRSTGQRVDDDRCPQMYDDDLYEDGALYYPLFLPGLAPVPAVGERVHGGNPHPPKRVSVVRPPALGRPAGGPAPYKPPPARQQGNRLPLPPARR